MTGEDWERGEIVVRGNLMGRGDRRDDRNLMRAREQER